MAEQWSSHQATSTSKRLSNPPAKTAEPTVRLAKFLASAGVSSRRQAERLIGEGQVTVNGDRVSDPAFGVSDRDTVKVAGEVVQPPRTEKTYIMLHKPIGVVSTMKPGKEGGPCVADLVPLPMRLFPVGRLDRDSSGLILLTNDGDLTLKLTHPSHEVGKEYIVKLHRTLIPRDIGRIRMGIKIEGRAVAVQALEPAHGGRIRIAITEGRNRIVRRLFGAIKYNVLELKRVQIGPLSIGHLPSGKWRKLRPVEIEALKHAAGM